MKSRQLANVLIKMLGLLICLYAIPSCVSGIIFGIIESQKSEIGVEAQNVITFAVGAGIQFVVGIGIIAGSQTIAGWMFKSDED